MKYIIINTLALVAIIITCPVWIIKTYIEVGLIFYESFKEGLKDVRK